MSNALSLTEEIELRSRLRSVFEEYVEALGGRPSVSGESDLTALAELLLDVREMKKLVEGHEAAVRARLNEAIPQSGILVLPGLVVLRETKERTDLDKARLRADLGSLEKYEKKTSYVTVSVKRGEAV